MSKVTKETTNTEIISIWQKTIDVQQHFNDIELKIRNLAITLLGGFVVGIGFSINEGLSVRILSINVEVSILICIGAIVVWKGFEFMDRYWYHPLLLGAVSYATQIEDENPEIFGKIGLTGSISKKSEVEYWGKTRRSGERSAMFYNRITIGLSIFLLLLLFSDPGKVIETDPSSTTSELVTAK